MTGLKSYRSVIWKPFPRSGVPEVFTSWEDFDSYVQKLVLTGCIDNGKRIWWDIRPHPFFSTIEFRLFEMDDLGSRGEMNYLRNLLESSQGTGADRQIALFQQTGKTSDVIQLLMQRTMQDIPASVV